MNEWQFHADVERVPARTEPALKNWYRIVPPSFAQMKLFDDTACDLRFAPPYPVIGDTSECFIVTRSTLDAFNEVRASGASAIPIRHIAGFCPAGVRLYQLAIHGRMHKLLTKTTRRESSDGREYRGMPRGRAVFAPDGWSRHLVCLTALFNTASIVPVRGLVVRGDVLQAVLRTHPEPVWFDEIGFEPGATRALRRKRPIPVADTDFAPPPRPVSTAEIASAPHHELSPGAPGAALASAEQRFRLPSQYIDLMRQWDGPVFFRRALCFLPIGKKRRRSEGLLAGSLASVNQSRSFPELGWGIENVVGPSDTFFAHSFWSHHFWFFDAHGRVFGVSRAAERVGWPMSFSDWFAAYYRTAEYAFSIGPESSLGSSLLEC